MITETVIILYRGQCDKCGNILEKSYDVMTVFDFDQEEFEELMEQKGWLKQNDNIFCSKCIDAKT